VLDYAREHGLQFGRDIAFTYGPLGFLTMPCYSEAAAAWQIAFSAALCFFVNSGLCLLAWRLKLSWKLATIATFICLALNMHSGADFLLNIGLLCWGLLCVLESSARLPGYVLCLVLFSVVGSLIKITFLFAATFSVVVIMTHLALRRQAPLAFAGAVVFCLCLIAGWELSGQKLANFPVFVKQGWEFSRWYDQAMGKEAPELIRWTGLLTLIFAALLIFLHSQLFETKAEENARWTKTLTTAWLSMLLFVSWKHGFVRLDEYHLELFAGFVVLLGLVLGASTTRRLRVELWAKCCTLLCCLLSFFMLVRYFESSPLDYFVFRPYDRFVHNLRVLIHPTRALKALKQAEESSRQLAALPRLGKSIGSASVDVFGNEQSFAILNGWNYTPRPVFQSYAAYSETLLQLNQNFYASTRTPDFILCRLAPIDHRLPALEDALLMPILLNGCDWVGRESDFLLLKPNRSPLPKKKLLQEGLVALGTNIDLRAYGETNLWLEIHATPTWAGKIRQLVYKSSELRLTASRGPNKSKATFKSPAPMMSGGFLASPLILRNEDLLAFYQSRNLVRPDAYSVSCQQGHQLFWSDNVLFRIYQLEIGRSLEPEPKD